MEPVHAWQRLFLASGDVTSLVDEHVPNGVREEQARGLVDEEEIRVRARRELESGSGVGFDRERVERPELLAHSEKLRGGRRRRMGDHQARRLTQLDAWPAVVVFECVELS